METGNCMDAEGLLMVTIQSHFGMLTTTFKTNESSIFDIVNEEFQTPESSNSIENALKRVKNENSNDDPLSNKKEKPYLTSLRIHIHVHINNMSIYVYTFLTVHDVLTLHKLYITQLYPVNIGTNAVAIFKY